MIEAQDSIWDITSKAAKRVALWPEWKRNIRIGKYSGLTRDECIAVNRKDEERRLSMCDYSW